MSIIHQENFKTIMYQTNYIPKKLTRKYLLAFISLLVLSVSHAQYRISTLVGVNPEGGLATRVKLNYPTGLTLDSVGNIYIADQHNHIIRKIDAVTGRINTIAGTRVAGFFGDLGSALKAQLNFPYDVTLDQSGNIYIADLSNHRVRKIDKTTNIITTIAGTGSNGYSGDYGLATSARLCSPAGLAIDTTGNLYIADFCNNVIRKVNFQTKIITTAAGIKSFGSNGGDGGLATSAYLHGPVRIALDKKQNLYVSSEVGDVIRKVNAQTGIISTIVGTGQEGFSGDGDSSTRARLFIPMGIALDQQDNLYIADQFNHRIRKIDYSNQFISTIAGFGNIGKFEGRFFGHNISASVARLNRPFDVEFDKQGNLYVADTYNHRIRKIDAQTNLISTIAGTGERGYEMPGYAGDQEHYRNARLSWPHDIAFDKEGNMYIVDTENHRVRKVFAKTGTVLTVLGTGNGYTPDDRTPANISHIDTPTGIAIDSTGSIYVASWRDNHIVKVNPDNTRQRIAGQYYYHGYGFSGDGGLATDARLHQPYHLTLNPKENILYIADRKNHRIRQVNLHTKIITTFAGNGIAGYSGDGDSATKAQINEPVGVTTDKEGNVFIVEAVGQRVRKVDIKTGIISTIAGTGVAGYAGDGGLATQARLYGPHRVVIDKIGNIFISEYDNRRIRKIHYSTGIITTVAGTGKPGSFGDAKLATQAQVHGPVGIALDSLENIYVADQRNHRIAKLTQLVEIDLQANSQSLLPSDTLSFGQVAYQAVKKSSVTIQNLGVEVPLQIQQLQVSGDFELEVSPPTQLTPNAQFLLSIRMKTNTLGKKSGLLTIISNDEDETTYQVHLQGEVVKASQSIAFTLGEEASQSTNTSKFTLQGTASSGLFVSYTSSDPGVATILGDQVTIVGAGTTEITARQVGNAFYNPAPPVTHTLTVTQAPHIAVFGTDHLPLFSATPNSFSASQPMIVEGNNLNDAINIQASGKFRVSIAPNDGFQTTLALNPANGNLNTTIYLRYHPEGASQDEGVIRLSSNGAIEKTVIVKGSSLPTINVSTNFLDAFNIREGQISFVRSFQVNGFNLDEDIVLTAPANFSISQDGSQFFSTLRLNVSNQVVANTTVYVHYTRALVGVDRNQILTLQSEGADTQTIQLNGEAFPHTSPFLQLSRSSMVGFSSIEREVSEPDSLSLKTYNISAEIRINAPPQFELSLDKQRYAQTLTIDGSQGDIDNQKVYVRFHPGSIGIFNGNLTFSSSGAPIQLVSLQGEAKSINGPLIRNVAPLQVRRGTKITIVGENFSPVPELNEITIRGQKILPSQMIEASRNLLLVEIPLLPPGKSTVNIVVGGKSNTSLDLLEILAEENSIPPVRNLNAFIRGRRTIQLTWNIERNAEIEKIIIERKNPDSTTYSPIAEISDLTNITYVDKDSIFFRLGETYFYRAIAKGINAEAEPSNEVGVVIPKNEVITGNYQNLPPEFLKVYPNPNTQGIFYFQFQTSSIPQGSLMVYTQSGKVLQEYAQIPTQIDLSKLPSGTYHLLLLTKQGKIKKTIVKN